MRRLTVSIALVLASAFSTEVTHAASTPTVVAVFRIRDGTNKLQPNDIDQLTRYLSAKVAETGAFQIVPEADLKRALEDKQRESYKACYDEACQIEIGREIAAQKSLFTEIVQLGESCALTTTLYDLKRAASELAATERGGCKVDDLVNMLERVAKKILTPAGAPVVVATEPNKAATTVVAAPRAGVAISASRLRVITAEPKLDFAVQLIAADGRNHPCERVSFDRACNLDGIAIGEGRLAVSTQALGTHIESIDVEPKNHTKLFTVKEIPSPGSVVAWTFGGLALAAGGALVPVGIAVDSPGMWIGGGSSLLVGAGLLALGFVFQGMIAVHEQRLDTP